MAIVAPMGDPAQDDVKPIPLECVLCPKKPKFSDISHLLTHVSSKSHLHHKFNIEFQAKIDPATRDRLRRYDKWYNDNGIEDLLAERLSAKDQKKLVKRGRPVASAKPKHAPEVVLETGQAIKADPDDDGYPTQAVLPSMAHWSTASSGHSLHLHEMRHDPYFDDTFYRSTEIKRGPSPYTYADPLDDPFRTTYTTSRSESETGDSTIPSDAAIVPADEEGQTTRLKGVVWPGMDLFDSATPEQKRKRNQRKDHSVLEQMKLTSQAVTAIECIWTPDGKFQRSRDIYASPSIDGSPEATPSRKRKYRARRRSPSKAEVVEPPRVKKGDATLQAKKRTRRAALADVTSVRQTRAATRSAAAGKNRITAESSSNLALKADDPEDVKIPIIDHDKTSFDVFRDAPQVSPGRTESPLDDMHENRFDLPHRPALQPLNSNMMVTSSAPLMRQHHPVRFYGGGMDTSHLGFRPPSSYNPGYMPSDRGIGGNSYNPLCAQPRAGVTYHQYHDSIFDDTKLPASTFQPINNRLDFNNFNVNPNTNPYANATQRDTTDFDL